MYHSWSAGRDFADGALNIGGSGEGEDSGTSNDTAPWSSCMSYYVLVWSYADFYDYVLLCEDYEYMYILRLPVTQKYILLYSSARYNREI
jgi:hypothetical protein